MKFKKIGLLLLLPLTLTATEPSKCTADQKALGLCEQLVNDLTKENTLLKEKVGNVAQQRDDAEKKLEKATEPAVIPAWGWALIGAAAGAGAVVIIRH